MSILSAKKPFKHPRGQEPLSRTSVNPPRALLNVPSSRQAAFLLLALNFSSCGSGGGTGPKRSPLSQVYTHTREDPNCTQTPEFLKLSFPFRSEFFRKKKISLRQDGFSDNIQQAVTGVNLEVTRENPGELPAKMSINMNDRKEWLSLPFCKPEPEKSESLESMAAGTAIGIEHAFEQYGTFKSQDMALLEPIHYLLTAPLAKEKNQYITSNAFYFPKKNENFIAIAPLDTERPYPFWEYPFVSAHEVGHHIFRLNMTGTFHVPDTETAPKYFADAMSESFSDFFAHLATHQDPSIFEDFKFFAPRNPAKSSFSLDKVSFDRLDEELRKSELDSENPEEEANEYILASYITPIIYRVASVLSANDWVRVTEPTKTFQEGTRIYKELLNTKSEDFSSGYQIQDFLLNQLLEEANKSPEEKRESLCNILIKGFSKEEIEYRQKTCKRY